MTSTLAKNLEKVSFDLPVEIITEILSRLPIKYLLRLKSICKTWYALIENPKFVQLHSKNYLITTSILLASSNYLYFNSEGCYNSIAFDYDFNYLSILGICNGLVCLKFDIWDLGFTIYNPSTRESRQICPPKLCDTDKGVNFFGFSLFSNDFKLVRVSYHISLVGNFFVKAEVYAMSSDNWMEIDVKIADRVVGVVNFDCCYIHVIPVVLNGTFYWAKCRDNDSRVVSFNVSDGFYDEIIVPDNLGTMSIEYKECWRIIEFEEELSLISYKGNRGFELWVLNEDMSSWTWKLKIPDVPFVSIPDALFEKEISVVGYEKNGELLLDDHYANSCELILYDLTNRIVKSFPGINIPRAHDFYFYTESLCSVKRRE